MSSSWVGRLSEKRGMAIKFRQPGIWKKRQEKQRRRKGDHRPAEERDRSRIIHCAAFRRLQAKTQVLGIGEGDFHRTRLTHTMEVAQIGRGIVLELLNGTEKKYKNILPTTA